MRDYQKILYRTSALRAAAFALWRRSNLLLKRNIAKNSGLLRPDKSIRDGIGKSKCPPRNDICTVEKFLFYAGME